jgi:hypothetical protein
MSVKRYMRMSYWLLGAMFSIVSCTDNIVRDGNGPDLGEEGEDLIPISLNLEGLYGDGASTYSLIDDGEQPGTGFENTANDVTVFVFNSSNVCEKIMKKTSQPIENPIGPELVKTGYKTFIVVVNGDAVLPTVYGEGDHALVSYNGLRQMLTKVATSLPGAPSFLMTGETAVTLSREDESTPNQVTLEVKRAVAKIKLFIAKSDKAVTHNITMQKITLHNGADRVYLLQDPVNNQINYNLSSAKTSFTPSGGAVPDIATGTYCELADTFYTYESLCGSDKSKAVYFELEAAVNSPANVRKARVYLAEDVRSPGDTVYNIHRNYWYNVYINIGNPGMDSVYVTVKSSPWNMADTMKAVVGGGYQIVDMAMPFKLVKNYTPEEFAKYPTYAAIEKHSRGASWLDLIVTDGVWWQLAFPSGAGNVDARMSADNGATWHDKIVNKGDDAIHRIFVYRPYIENAEPESGPTFSLNVGGSYTGGSYSGGTYSGGTIVRDFVVQPRDTAYIPTNCYILRPQLQGTPLNETRAYIPLKGVYRYWEDYLLQNGDTILPGSVTAEILWQDHPSGSGVVKNNVSIVNPTDRRDGAYLYVEAGTEQGNALVAMKVGSTIYWSFHLWVTEYNPYEAAGQLAFGSSSSISNIFMDRNLGALSNKYTADKKAAGLYYQFGRKDPFYSTDKTNINNTVNVWTSSLSPPLSLRPLTAIPEMLKHPNIFYDYGAFDDVWPLSLEDSCLWNTPGGKKTAFDPCPEGWRIPKQKGPNDNDSPWYGLSGSNFTTVSGYEEGRYNVRAGYYPYSGFVDNGRINNNPLLAYYWTSLKEVNKQGQPGTMDDRYGSGLFVSSGTPPVHTGHSIYKYWGASVRCVVDLHYVLETAGGGGLFGNSAGGMDEDIIE